MKLCKRHLIKIIPALVCILFFSQDAKADHLKGGWIKYEYLGANTSTTSKYRVTLYQYIRCGSLQDGQIDKQIYLGVVDNSSGRVINTYTIPNSGEFYLNKDTASESPCIYPKQEVCYRIEYFTYDIILTNNDAGYTLVEQRCCRIDGINNIVNSGDIGFTYTVTIPGKISGTTYYNNNSPVFPFTDTTLICYNTPFSLNFGASDIDGDKLIYSFCYGQNGGAPTTNGAAPNPPSNPPYASIPYSAGYSGSIPLGPNVSIDPNTGIISGIAPSTIGTYAITVCVDEYRNGVLIGKTRKDVHVDVANCQLDSAKLKPEYITCDGFSFSFSNETTTSSGANFFWDFGDLSTLGDTSVKQKPSYTYSDTGIYTIKLRVANSRGCKDSTTAKLKVFPGFIPDFDIVGSCIQNPYQFIDKTSAAYGSVNTWKWDFGDISTLADTSHKQTDFYSYADTGKKLITLISTSSKGCIDSTTQTLYVNDGPDLFLRFKDTLICSIDTLRLNSSTTSNNPSFTWSPAYNIVNPNVANPEVFPQKDTTYHLFLTSNGCTAEDSIKVRVTDAVSLSLQNDTSICRTDTLQISPITNALYFTWTPRTYLSDNKIPNPIATPLSDSIKYYLLAEIGKCQATDSITIKTVPYPISDAGNDARICYGKTVKLIGNTDASSFIWTPTNSLLNSTTLQPTAGPQSTTTYYLTATDNKGCPKPVTDSVTVTVIQPVKVNAGNDQNVVINQPVQLNANGGGVDATYQWSPSTYLSNPNIENPVAVFPPGIDTFTYRLKTTTPYGCIGYDTVTFNIFQTEPEIFIPSAFTPNGDGKNDILKPILAGIKNLVYFSIFDRWGNLVFKTGDEGIGWDGTYKGVAMPSGTYAYMAHVRDYNGKFIDKKGTIVLIR